MGRRDVAELAVENSELKNRMGDLEVQFSAMRAVLASHHAVAAVPPAAPRNDVAVQATMTGEDTTERWNQQLKAVSEWLQTGAALFRDGHMRAQGNCPISSVDSVIDASSADPRSLRQEPQTHVLSVAPKSGPVRP